jgi:hypothetical protein
MVLEMVSVPRSAKVLVMVMGSLWVCVSVQTMACLLLVATLSAPLSVLVWAMEMGSLWVCVWGHGMVCALGLQMAFLTALLCCMQTSTWEFRMGQMLA